MNCIAPEEIREGYLLAYVGADSSICVKDHVARCPACAAEAQSLARVNQSLLANLYRTSCPKTETLIQYHSKLLQVDTQRQAAVNQT